MAVKIMSYVRKHYMNMLETMRINLKTLTNLSRQQDYKSLT
jgi:hypothetical protein